jgi:hypothetical protein
MARNHPAFWPHALRPSQSTRRVLEFVSYPVYQLRRLVIGEAEVSETSPTTAATSGRALSEIEGCTRIPAPQIYFVRVPGHPAAVTFNALSRVVPVAAFSTALIGIAGEITARLVLDGGRAVWLFKPYLYAGLPKPFVRTDWLSVAASVALAVVLLFWSLLLRSQLSKRTPPFMWLGLGIIFGGAIGEAVTGIALGTSTNILVARRGAWGYAFSPFNVEIVIGFLLLLPGLLHSSRLLRDPQGPFRWRDMLRRREDSGG